MWGAEASGSTYTPTKEIFSVMNIPYMNYHKFQCHENILREKWRAELQKSIEQAGKEERELAVKCKQIDEDGIPWTCVYADGGWSKRSYGHSFDANSGVAVIIGKLTGKVLYLGVRNKNCVVCTRASNKGKEALEHTCYKNYEGSSTGMEAAIIVEGFQKNAQLKV